MKPSCRFPAFMATLGFGLLVTTAPAHAGPGYALSFNGTNQYVTVPDQDALTCTNSFTWEAWVNITKTSWPYYEEWVTILAKDNFGGEGWFAIASNGVVDVRFNGQSFSAQSAGTITFQTWQHVAVAWDGSDMRFYLNGQLDRTVAYSSPLIANTASGLLIGMCSGIGSYRFQGQMDELRLWNVARSQAEIQAAMNRPLTGSESGLVAYWPFDEASGTTVSNRAAVTGSACNGSLSNAPTWVVATIPSFQFAPDVATAAATISPTNATLNGTVNPGNLPTTAWFEWGTTTNYGNTTASTYLPATNLNLAVSADLDGLTPGQTYYFRLVATNSAGSATGNGLSFQTSVFTDLNAGLPGVVQSSVAWGDYDNDGRLDVLLTGHTGSGGISRVYRNLTPITNTPPATPTGLTTLLSLNSVTLAWTAASDAQTPAAGLSYNLRVGSTPGGAELLPPMSAGNGQRRLPQAGNAGQRFSRTFVGLPLGQPIYWSVQAVDTSFGGSTFAAEKGFAFNTVFTPTNGIPVPGDVNGDGVVDQSELDAVLSNYWPTSPWLQMTNAAGLGGSNITFALTNATAGAFSVESSTNLADWEFLGPATPRYEFSDTNAPAVPQRFYRLRWP